MKKYLYLILFFLVCVPAIAGTINSYTLKSPPDSADTVVIYDSDDGSTKKAQIGDISGSSSSGINWTAYTDLTALGNANEFIVNDSGTSKSINWEVFQTQIPTSSGGWTDSGTSVYLTTSTDTIGIGTSGATNTINFGGNTARSIGILRQTTNADGNNLTINAGGGTSGGTDLDGGDLILQGGQPTGLGQSYVRLRAASSGTATGTTENAPVDRVVVVPGKTITDDTPTDLFSIDVAAGTSCGGTIIWETSTVNAGLQFQIMSGITNYSVFNNAGTMTAALVSSPNQAASITTGTLENLFIADQSSSTFTIKLSHNSSLTPTSGHPRIQYTLLNNCYKNVTIL